jgi:uncharacterized protein YcbX
MSRITQLFTYPVKSLGGIQLDKATITETGLEWDREWMLVDETGRFVSQRELPQMVLFKLSMDEHFIRVQFGKEKLSIPKAYRNGERLTCTVWDDEVMVMKEDKSLSDWFSAKLQKPLTLVRRSAETVRMASRTTDMPVSFPDGGQYLVCGEEALADLNRRMEKPVKMDRFRPNIVFSGGEPFAEDHWKNISIGGNPFAVTKPCGRCSMTTIDQDSTEAGKEPLKTLATYRRFGNSVNFGIYLHAAHIGGTLRIGDTLHATATTKQVL